MIYFWNSEAEKSHGGGFHFLTILKRELKKQQQVTSDLLQTDSILVDSYHGLIDALTYKFQHPSIALILRFGPIFQLHRAWYWRLIDHLMIVAANHAVDLVIFQSEWSLRQAQRLGFDQSVNHFIIHNSVDETVFYPSDDKKRSTKIRLIATSWSNNWKKGFRYFHYLDEYLDWSKYDATFIGNSPIAFKHIRHVPPLPATDLAEQLRQHDIYIAAMEDDACSNALLEALACGLTVAALDSGANAELIGGDDVLFTSPETMLEAIAQGASTSYTPPSSSSMQKYRKALDGVRGRPRRRFSLWYYLGATGLYALFYVFHNVSSLTTQ